MNNGRDEADDISRALTPDHHTATPGVLGLYGIECVSMACVAVADSILSWKRIAGRPMVLSHAISGQFQISCTSQSSNHISLVAASSLGK